MHSISLELLHAAIIGVDVKLDELKCLRAALVQQLEKRSQFKPVKEKPAPKNVAKLKGITKRNLSPDARERIAAAQKKRWAAFRKAKA